MRTERWRAVDEGDGWQLYDMPNDPSEKQNVAGAHPDVVAQLRTAYERWMADVTRVPIIRPPIPVGYSERPVVELPAPEAYFSGTIHWYNRFGFAHDWLTGWSDVNDSIWWEVDVVTGGDYKVLVRYTCPPPAVGTRLRVECDDAHVESTLALAYNPEPLMRPTRDPKKRFIQSFARQPLGTISLEKGRHRITIRALDKQGEYVCDVKSLTLTRLD